MPYLKAVKSEKPCTKKSGGLLLLCRIDMYEKKMIEAQIKFLKDSASEDWRTEQSLFELRHYDMCLFCCHLAIEKYLKALILLRTNRPAPFTHSLKRLTEIAGLTFSLEEQNDLGEITTFNISGRYRDIKYQFYKKATKTFCKKYFEISNYLIVCLKKEFQKI